MDIIARYIHSVDKLVPRPEIALKALNMAMDPRCSIPLLSTQIERDPSLTANMLRLANSAFFGHMRTINSVREIIVRLGITTVQMLAISSATVSLLKNPQEAYNLEPGELWNHSYAVALLAAIIGRHSLVDDLPALYTAALLHDVGKIILNRDLQTAMLESADSTPEMTLLAYERKLLGTDHPEVGAALLAHWELPPTITHAVSNHHDSHLSEDAPLVHRIVNLANWLENTLGLHTASRDALRVDDLFLAHHHAQFPPVPGFSENFPAILEEFLASYPDSDTSLSA